VTTVEAGAPRSVGGRWPGFFVSFEGVDGAGKTTQVAALGMALRHDGYEVVAVREPGDTALGELARSLLLAEYGGEPIDPWAEALVFIAARAQLLRQVALPALERGAVVIADRYVDSTLAYQGGGRGLDIEALRRLHRDTCGDVWPDLTLLLDLPREAAETRQRASQLPFDRMESAPAGFHAAVLAAFRTLAAAEPQRIVTIAAGRPAVVVSQDIWAAVSERLGELREELA
jgi:dTMP kinase